MKKFIYFVLSIILLLSTIAFMPACGDGFEIVAQIDFTTNGEKITKNSTYTEYDTCDSYDIITKNEFDEKYLAYMRKDKDVDYGIKFDDKEQRKVNVLTEKYLKEINQKINSKNVYCSIKTDPKDLSYSHYYLAAKRFGENEYTIFYHCKGEYTSYSFTLVKIIDNQTLQIADNDGITTYTVSSYKITYIKTLKNND